MKAEFDGQDYMLILDKDQDELLSLWKGKLEAYLTEAFGDKDLGKIVTLELGENKGSDGIEVKYIPKNEIWENIQRIQVKMNKDAYNHVNQRGNFGTRYGIGDKIEIFNGDPRER